ncbi:MAG: hypothetical protein K5985_04320 [Lachnospiraceae bacterium]|nr:hypothetical protein [Lachnospiraceae bacterium]
MKNLNNKIISLLLAAALLAGCSVNLPAGGAENYTPPVPHSITEASYPLYFKTADDKSEISLCFPDGGDVPFITMEEALDLLNRANDRTEQYELKYDKNHAVITRKDTSFDADFDFDSDTITFYDYNAFLRMEGCPLIDAFELDRPEANPFFKTRYANDRYGKAMSFDLAAYEIDLIKEGDGWYMPLQTFSDLFLSHYLLFSLFNRECVIIADNVLDEELSDIYYSASGTISEELARFSYNELCLALDNLYGLKEIHDIDSFDEYFFEAGLKKKLMGTDSVSADAALMELINLRFDDLHSTFSGPSYSTDEDALDEVLPGWGPWKTRFENARYIFGSARDEAFPDGVPPYEEVGNTAYITFDKFTVPDEKIDYMSDPKEEELYDTVRLIQYSCDRILRPDSPVENIVMDLSNNTGGYADAAAYVIAAFTGRGEVDVKDTMTGATSTVQYVIDTNRDGEFDMEDTVAEKGYNLYCLTSPVSFSCGNLVPNVFKTSPFVTLLGQTSGGGSCSIASLSTARGSMIHISSNFRMSMFKNGSFYDIDLGAEPDCYIAKIEDYYNREALTEYINGIY